MVEILKIVKKEIREFINNEFLEGNNLFVINFEEKLVESGNLSLKFRIETDYNDLPDYYFDTGSDFGDSSSNYGDSDYESD